MIHIYVILIEYQRLRFWTRGFLATIVFIKKHRKCSNLTKFDHFFAIWGSYCPLSENFNVNKNVKLYSYRCFTNSKTKTKILNLWIFSYNHFYQKTAKMLKFNQIWPNCAIWGSYCPLSENFNVNKSVKNVFIYMFY